MSDTVPARPNVLILLSDQHNPRFMGCAGHPLLRTPHLDALAARGTRFSSANCNFPLCGPSRMAFLTARHASEIGCLTNHCVLSSETPTFAHAFHAAGYETVLCGRMHFNGPDQRHGFQRRILGDVGGPFLHRERNYLKKLLGVLKDTTGPNSRSIRESGKGDSGYLRYDEAVSAAAADWLRARGANGRNTPFLLTVGFVQPHAPFVAREEDYKRYDSLVRAEDLPPDSEEGRHPELVRFRRESGLEDTGAPDTADRRRATVAYHGMCDFLDQRVGEVLGALEAAGLAENTIVVYTSDHGEQLGEHGLWWKHTLLKGSIGVPLLMAGPGVPRGSHCNRNVGLIDVGPTLLDLCGATPVPDASGCSFRCLLDGASGSASQWKDEVLAENLWPQDSQAFQRMVLRGPWKLIVYPGFDPQLFNLEQDPGETRDLARKAECRQVMEALTKALTRLPDPAVAMEDLQRRRRSMKWIADGFRSGDLPDADTAWFEDGEGSEPGNYVIKE